MRKQLFKFYVNLFFLHTTVRGNFKNSLQIKMKLYHYKMKLFKIMFKLIESYNYKREFSKFMPNKKGVVPL
jgi:hypothetical protein